VNWRAILTGVGVTVRRAGQEDQAAIIALVRHARLNPRGLAWPRFVVAETDRDIVGVAQVRLHPDGARELASLVVQSASRGQGIATAMIDALLAEERGEVYTLIDRRFRRHFERWGFRAVDPDQLPRSVSRVYRVGRVVTAIGALLRRERIRIMPLMRSTSTGQSP
jgi:N-acetylglutamate synthase-like GNAT family acetyltransferase